MSPAYVPNNSTSSMPQSSSPIQTKPFYSSDQNGSNPLEGRPLNVIKTYDSIEKTENINIELYDPICIEIGKMNFLVFVLDWSLISHLHFFLCMCVNIDQMIKIDQIEHIHLSSSILIEQKWFLNVFFRKIGQLSSVQYKWPTNKFFVEQFESCWKGQCKNEEDSQTAYDLQSTSITSTQQTISSNTIFGFTWACWISGYACINTNSGETYLKICFMFIEHARNWKFDWFIILDRINLSRNDCFVVFTLRIWSEKGGRDALSIDSNRMYWCKFKDASAGSPTLREQSND